MCQSQENDLDLFHRMYVDRSSAVIEQPTIPVSQVCRGGEQVLKVPG